MVMWALPDNFSSIAVPPITIGAVGSNLCTLLIARERYNYALTILVTSYVMTGVGTLLACGIMIIYFQRLAVHHLPPREVITSTFLPLGPCGQGGFALIELVRLHLYQFFTLNSLTHLTQGRNAMHLFPLLAASQPTREGFTELVFIGPAMFGTGVVTGLLLWG